MGETVYSSNDSPCSRPSASSSAESSFREHDNVFLQTKTRVWLGEVLHTRLDDQIKLSELLADGELLLDVSKVVWAMLLGKCKELKQVKGPKFNPIGSRKSIGRYRPYSNVDSFLKICKILGLNDVDLFSPSDVVEKRDTRKVCICIRSLSKKARSKQLKVPKFDNVTSSVTMPTVMVGCLRKSLELSKCSSKEQLISPHEDIKLKSRQNHQFGVCDSNHGSCSEASDDSECYHMEQLTYSLSNSNSYDSASQKGIDDSPEVSSALCKSYRDIQELVKNDNELRCYELSCSEEQTRSFCSEYGESSTLMLNNTSSSSVDSDRPLCTGDINFDNSLKNREAYFPDDASFIRDSLDNLVERLYISPQFAFPDITLGLDNGSVAFDGEDDVYNLLMSSNSQGSISTARTCENGFERRSSDDFDDVEVSSVSSMSSVFGRVLNMDFDEQFDVGDLKHEIQDIDDYENSEQSCISDAENRIFKSKYGNSGFCNKRFVSCTDTQLDYAEDKEHIGSPKKHFDVSPVKDLDLKYEEQNLNGTTINEADRVIRCFPEGCLIVPCNYITAERNEEIDSLGDGICMESTHQCLSSIKKYDRSRLKPEGFCSAILTSKDQNKCENVENLVELSDGIEDRKKKLSKIKPHKRHLLGTVVKGTAVFGMMFFLLYLRNNLSGNDNRGDIENKSIDIQRSNSTRSTIKAQKRARENGIYPADKFNFKN